MFGSVLYVTVMRNSPPVSLMFLWTESPLIVIYLSK